MKKDLVEAPIKLALRVEGHYWVAYVAKRHGMDGAFEIGRIAIRAAEESVEIKDAFMDLMKKVFSSAVRDTVGAEPIWSTPPRPAPESERSGNA